MKKLLFLLLLIFLTPSVAGITLDLNANFSEPILLPNESSLLSINLTLDSNVTGANLLIIDVIYDSGKGWNYSAYSASINGKAMIFNVSEADVNVSGVLKHRITFANSSLNISQPTSILLNTYLKTPEVNLSYYPIDVIVLWSYPDLNVTEIKNVSLNISVSKPELYPSSIVFSNEKPLEGENITITAVIHNMGGRANANVVLRVDGIQKANTTHLFNAGSVHMINFSWSCVEGKHSIEIVVDPENDVDEINETNNSISREISVMGGTPVLSNLTIIPEMPKVGSTVNISVDVSKPYIKSVIANLTYPDGSTSSKAMSSTNNATFNTTFNVTQYGIYRLEIRVTDLAGRTNNTTTFFGGVIFISTTFTLENGTEGIAIDNQHLIIRVKANESGNGTASFNATISQLPFKAAINESTSGVDTCIKYLNLSSMLKNITEIRIELHYTDDEVEGLYESGLAIFYWNGSKWIKCEDYEGRLIPGGPFVYEAGRNPEENYVYVVVNQTSEYGVGGYLDTDGDGIPDFNDACPNQPENFNGYQDEDGCPDTPPSRRGGGGGGGGFYLVPTPTPTPTVAPTITATPIKKTPYIPTPTPYTAIETPTKTPTALPTEVPTLTPAPWWQQPMRTIAIATVVITIVLLAYLMRRK